MNPVLHPEADAEFLDAVSHYAQISPALGTRFYDEMSAVLQKVSQHPLRYRSIDRSLRRLLAAGFPYAVIYAVKADYVWILAVMHLKRRPGYWKHRLEN